MPPASPGELPPESPQQYMPELDDWGGHAAAIGCASGAARRSDAPGGSIRFPIAVPVHAWSEAAAKKRELDMRKAAPAAAVLARLMTPSWGVPLFPALKRPMRQFQRSLQPAPQIKQHAALHGLMGGLSRCIAVRILIEDRLQLRLHHLLDHDLRNAVLSAYLRPEGQCQGQCLLKVSQSLPGVHLFHAVGLGGLPQTHVPALCFHCRSRRPGFDYIE